MEKIKIVLGCHPGERVAKKVGVMVANNLQRRGHPVDVIRMPEVMKVEGRVVPYWEAFAIPGMLKKRFDDEAELATKSPENLTVTFHDGPVPDYTCRVLKPHLPSGRLVEVEVSAPLRPLEDRVRHSYVPQMQREGMDEKERSYVTHETDINHPEAVARLSTRFAERVADLVLEVGSKDDRWLEIF